ncbi:hypothetical protein GCM10009123_15790 [Kangiella japonica]|uniref:Uncharacterized protein n=1 Tax=Kangiella japonica TaxID=647384 RepID=A0ABP3CL82_9GAMM
MFPPHNSIKNRQFNITELAKKGGFFQAQECSRAQESNYVSAVYTLADTYILQGILKGYLLFA